jgi:hypothetical protein
MLRSSSDAGGAHAATGALARQRAELAEQARLSAPAPPGRFGGMELPLHCLWPRCLYAGRRRFAKDWVWQTPGMLVAGRCLPVR